MQAQSSIIRIIGRAFRVLFSNLGSFLPLALLFAVPSTVLREGATAWLKHLIVHWLPAHGPIIEAQQAEILAITLADVIVLPLVCALGAFTTAAMIHVYLRASEGQPVRLGDALTFAANRWKRLILPYTLATLVIWVGSIVIIPGILYTLFYAFVAPVAVLDEGVKGVLTRSTKLTRGRRGRIFRTYLFFVWWWGWYATLGALIIAPLHWAARHALAVGNELVGFWIGMALLQLYLERMKQLQELIDQREAESTAPGDTVLVAKPGTAAAETP